MVLARILTVGALSGLALGGTAFPAAAAAPIEHSHYHDSISFDVERCGLQVHLDIVEDGSFMLIARGDGMPYGAARYTGTTTFTNLANDKTVTASYSGQTRDSKWTDNGDGTSTLTITSTGRNTFRLPDGKLVAVHAGTTQVSELFDNGGTPTDPSDDQFLTFLGVTRETGHTAFIDDQEYCDTFLIPSIG